MRLFRYFSIILVFLFFIFKGYSQERKIVELNDSVRIEYVIKKFNPKNSEIDSVKVKSVPDSSYIITKINGRNYYGSDGEMPINYFHSLKIRINNRLIRLNTRRMFNPSFSYELDKEMFKLEMINVKEILKAWFSDGAGWYCVKWEIKGQDSERMLISTDERNFYD